MDRSHFPSSIKVSIFVCTKDCFQNQDVRGILAYTAKANACALPIMADPEFIVPTEVTDETESVLMLFRVIAVGFQAHVDEHAMKMQCRTMVSRVIDQMAQLSIWPAETTNMSTTSKVAMSANSQLC